MADRAPITARRRDMYVPERDNPEAMAMQEEVRRRYDETMAPYREMKQAAIQRAYDETLRRTGSEDAARRTADAVAARMSRTETLASFAIPEAAIAGVGRAVGTARNVLGGLRGRNAMTAEEALTPTNRLVVDRPATGGYSGSGYNAGPLEQIPFKPNYASGAQMERMPAPPRPDVRSVPDELAVLEGEGGATADAVAQARRMAQERAAAERGFRETQLATMEGEGGGAEALRAAQQRAREAEAAFIERQMMEAEGEGMGAFASRNRPPPRRYSADQDAAAGYGYTTEFPSRALAPRYTGSEAATQAGREVVPVRTAASDLEALMNRHFGGAEAGGLPMRGPTYYSNPPATGPRLIGESFAGESPAYAASVRTNLPQGGIPDWMKYALPAGAALAGGTYLASGRGQEPERRLDTFEETNIGAPQFAPPQQPTARMASDILRQYGMNAFTQPKAESSDGTPPGFVPPPPRPERKERGFLDRLIGQPTQSMGGELMQDGKINWGSGESAADFVRASQAMRKMQDEGRKFEDIQGINPELEGRKSGGKVDEDKSLKRALEIIHHLVKR